MYPRNNATPPRLAIGQVVQISDGAVQTSGVAITVRSEGGSEVAGLGTIAYGSDGTVYYTPTQAETNYTAFVVIANKASCFSVSLTVITTASPVSGTVEVNDKTGYSISGTKTTLDALSDFDPAADTVANVTTVQTTVSNTDMRGTDGANTVTPNTVVPDNASITAILADTNELQTNQGDWATADVSSLATQASVNTVDTVVDAIKVKTDQLTFTVANQVDSNALTGGGGDDAATIYAHFTSGSNEDAFKADVSALLTDANYTASLPANFSTLIIGTGADLGKVTTSNPAAGSGSSHTAQDVANLILGGTQDPIATNASGEVVAASVTASVSTDSASRNASKADVSGLATSASIAALNDFNPATDEVTTDAASRLASQANVTGLATAASIAALNDFDPTVQVVITDTNSRIASQADVSGLATSAEIAALHNFNPATDEVTTDAASRTASQANVTGLATSADVAALNDLTAQEVANAVLDEPLSSHNVGGSVGKAIRQVKEGLVTVESQVNDGSPSASSFVTSLTETDNGFHNDKVIVFINGDLAGQSRIVADYDGSTKRVTFDEPLTSTPSNGDEFIILSMHIHPVAQIATSVTADMDANSTKLTGIIEDTGTTIPDAINNIPQGGLSPGTQYRFTNNGGGSGFDIVTITEE